jgi:hypothetical protein
VFGSEEATNCNDNVPYHLDENLDVLKELQLRIDSHFL